MIKKIISIFLLLSSFTFFSQQKQGNIVEYFGKEKVNDVSEGDVVYIFEEGLILPFSGVPFNSASVKNDAVFMDALTNGMDIFEGKQVINHFNGEQIKWEFVKVDGSSEFHDSRLQRNGYLYLEYNSSSEKILLFEASGHTNVIINGLPHEGEHYDFGWSLIPIKLKKGENKFLLSGGRFPRIRARLLESFKPVEFTMRDLTLPDMLKEGSTPVWGAIRIINAKDGWLKGAKIRVEINDASKETFLGNIAPLNVRKVPFQIPVPSNLGDADMVQAKLYLQDHQNNIIDTVTIELAVKSKYNHHKNTFLSDIDNSVQYYSVAPSLTKDKENQAMFLSVHLASVEAVNQANAYKQKDWGHVVAPTNRRPFGFAWEDWGRLDALEVLNRAEELLHTDPKHTYLTGHSMGGHGTWYLGATYPDRFAAIAPAAGYPDLLGYRQSFINRMASEDFQKRFGMSEEEFKIKISGNISDATEKDVDSMIRRAGNPSRTLKLMRNYLHYGVYILHGDSDNVVPTFLARDMRERLGKYHNDFAYYEYPGGEHWFGDESVDWPPIFYFFNRREIKNDSEIDKINFSTGSPGVSAGSHFIKIVQQEEPFEISNFDFERTENGFNLNTLNISVLSINVTAMEPSAFSVINIDGQELDIPITGMLYLKKSSEKWEISEKPSASEKSPLRNGGFKDAFRHNMVFVYASRGNKQENDWYYNRAKFDAEKFWYRANGSIQIVKDTDFRISDFKDRNVIIYGNKSNNAAWKMLLKNSPIQVSNNEIQIRDKVLRGNQYGAYFISPKPNSDFNSIGVVTATGIKGMHAAYANDYLENGTFYPDVIIFDEKMPKQGLSGVKFTGFFGNDWSIENGKFIWNQ